MRFDKVVIVVKNRFWLSMTKGERLNLLEKLATEGICNVGFGKGNQKPA